MMTKDIQIVGLRIGRETYGVPISLVREIVRVPEITAVPNAQKYVEGVINLRGKIISVVDLRKRFGETEVENNKKNRIVVVELENRTVGLIVNSASEVLKIPPSDIEPPSSVFLNGEIDYVTGVGKLNNRLIILVDLNKILDGGELHHLDEVNSPVVEHLA
ncbi:MAG: chemotaxis protein CheW [Candidatus Acidiferrales bacterium]